MENNPINKIKECIENIENKNFNVYFYTIDSKGAPNSYVYYIYQTAKIIKDMGYNVHFLHQEKEFEGVASWMGEEYANIPHHNIETEKIEVSPSDFLFIPEFYSNVMNQTSKMPCKRVVIAQNFNYLTQVIPAGATWEQYGIKDCIVTTNRIQNEINNCFPKIKTYKVNPCIDETIFYNDDKPKKLIFNIVCKDNTDINQIVKPFYWKYPMYSWVSFRDLRNLPREDFANYLRSGAFTIWYDRDTEFGNSALEAMASGSILIGKVPENEPEWLIENGNIQDNGVWFFNVSDVHTIIAGAIESYINDELPDIVIENMKNTAEKYNCETFKHNVTEVYVNNIFNNRKIELETSLAILENKNQ